MNAAAIPGLVQTKMHETTFQDNTIFPSFTNVLAVSLLCVRAVPHQVVV